MNIYILLLIIKIEKAMQNKFIYYIEKTLVPFSQYLAKIKILTAIKDGLVVTLPFVVVGSVILLLLNLPLNDTANFLYSQWYVDLMAKYKGDWVQAFYASMGVLSLFAVAGFGYSYAKQYQLPELTGALLSIFVFILLCAPVVGWPPMLTAKYFDGKGLFSAIISGVLAIQVLRFTYKYKLTINLPQSVPSNILKSFQAITPVVFLVIILQPINILLAKTSFGTFPDFVMGILAPFINASDNLISILFIVLLIHLLWFVGIHGGNMLTGIVVTITTTNLAINQEALSTGLIASKIWSGGFLDAYVFLGGVGATLGLAIAMSFSKKESLKAVGKFSVVPGIFNINEPIMFGTPVVLNPILGIPFIILPVINTTIAYIALKYFGVAKIVALVPWTMPSPLAAFLSSNGSILALLLSLLLILLSVLVYIPFIKIYEKTLSN
jgi:PTS system cellobiose-specific IIC component